MELRSPAPWGAVQALWRLQAPPYVTRPLRKGFCLPLSFPQEQLGPVAHPAHCQPSLRRLGEPPDPAERGQGPGAQGTLTETLRLALVGRAPRLEEGWVPGMGGSSCAGAEQGVDPWAVCTGRGLFPEQP